MKISTKGIYALKAIVDLAIYSKGESVSIKSISERQGISDRYLEQIFSTLKKSELINGRKGANGGYSLNSKPSDITVLDVLTVVEGELLQVSITDNLDNLDAVLKEYVWDSLDKGIRKELSNITIDDLRKRYEEKESGSYMFYI